MKYAYVFKDSDKNYRNIPIFEMIPLIMDSPLLISGLSLVTSKGNKLAKFTDKKLK